MGLTRTIAFWRFGSPFGTPTHNMGVHFGVWGFIPSHFLALSGACDVILRSFSWLATLQPLALVASPRLGLRQKVCATHHSFQPIHHWMGCPRCFDVHFQKGNDRDALSTPIQYYQNTSQIGQGKGKKNRKKEGGYDLTKNYSIKHLVRLGGMESFFLKGMYVVRLLVLTHVIWLKGNKFTYVAKNLLTLVVLAK